MVATVPAGYLAKRMVVEVPFVLFAALMPFIAPVRASTWDR